MKTQSKLLAELSNQSTTKQSINRFKPAQSVSVTNSLITLNNQPFISQVLLYQNTNQPTRKYGIIEGATLNIKPV